MTTKILPVNYIDDIESFARKETCNAIGIEEMSVTYVQPADTNSHPDEVQHLTITTRTAESVGLEDIAKSEGFYFDITIPQGEHWSVDDGDSLKALVDDLKKRLYMTTEHNKPKEKK